MQAPLDKDRRFLGFTVFDSCYLDENGVIYNGSGNTPFHCKAATLEPIKMVEVLAYIQEYITMVAATDINGPIPELIRYLDYSGKLVSEKPIV